MIARLRRNWEQVLFVWALMILAFGYGIVVMKFKVWPHRVLNMAYDAAKDWQQNWRKNLDLGSQFVRTTGRSAGGVVVYDQALAWPGLTLLSGYRDDAFQLWLVDMSGAELHHWQVPMAEAFPTTPAHLESLPDIGHFHGVALMPDGDVVMNVVGAGTVRLDRCSRVVWVHVGYTHHSIDLLPDGSMLVPDQVDVAGWRPDRSRIAPGPNGYYTDHGLLHLAAGGKVLRHISLSDAVHRGDRAGLLLGDGDISPQFAVEDPFHMNDAEMLRPAMAGAFPMFRAGDIMLSLRNTSQIVMLDGMSWLPKWALRGPFFSQHDPDFMPNGHLLVYDNQYVADEKMSGRSRILEIDPATQSVVWSYDGGDANPFYAPARGKVQLLPNGNVLILDPEEGRVFEVARSRGDGVAWDYVHLIAPGSVGVLIDAERVAPESLAFLDQPCD